MNQLEQAVCTNCQETKQIHKTYKVCVPCYSNIEKVFRCIHVANNPDAIRSVEMFDVDGKLNEIVLTCEECRFITKLFRGENIHDTEKN